MFFATKHDPLNQWKIAEDFDIPHLFLNLQLQGVNFLETK